MVLTLLVIAGLIPIGCIARVWRDLVEVRRHLGDQYHVTIVGVYPILAPSDSPYQTGKGRWVYKLQLRSGQSAYRGWALTGGLSGIKVTVVTK